MQKTDLDFFLNQNVQIELSSFVLSLFCAAVLSFIVHLFYIRFSSTLSNRIEFSKNFVVLRGSDLHSNYDCEKFTSIITRTWLVLYQ